MCTFDKETFLLSIFGVHSFHKFDIFQVPLSFSFPKKALPISYVVTTRIVGYSFSSLLLEVFDIITHNYASHFKMLMVWGGFTANWGILLYVYLTFYMSVMFDNYRLFCFSFPGCLFTFMALVSSIQVWIKQMQSPE